MIKKIVIKSFKSIEELDLNLGRVNLFIGPNGAGKSNILESLGVIGAAAYGLIDDESLLRRGVRPGVPALYKTSFRNLESPKYIHFRIDSDCAAYDIAMYNPIKEPEPAWRYHSESIWAWESDEICEKKHLLFGRSNRSSGNLNPSAGFVASKMVDISEESPAFRLFSAIRDYAIFTPVTSVLRGIVPDNQQRQPLGLSGGRLGEAVEEILRQSPKASEGFRTSLFNMIDWVKAIGVKIHDKNLYISKNVPQANKSLFFQDKYMKDVRNTLSAYDASEGALFVLFAFALALHDKSPKIFSIDNFDHGLNPRLSKALIKNFCEWIFFRKEGRQVLLTSHNPLILDGLPLKNPDVKLFTVDRTEEGRTVVQEIALGEKLEKKIEKGWTLSRLWTAGHLGGVPNI